MKAPGQVTAAELTASDNHDSLLVDKLLKHNARGLASFTADGPTTPRPSTKPSPRTPSGRVA